MTSTPDLAQVRFDNAMALFDEFVNNTVKSPDAATLRGLEGRFALKVQVQPSYWSQIKSRARQIGERLARQFEQLCNKPYGWMDQVHRAGPASPVGAQPALQDGVSDDSLGPQDDDERFIIGLVLTYYRRHPQRARNRLLDLLGEVLTPAPAATVPSKGLKPAAAPSGKPVTTPQRTASQATDDDMQSLWLRSQSGVAPLKRKK